jgi:hypothetical protein
MASRAAQAAVTSIRWFVVYGSLPPISTVFPFHVTTAP